MLIEEMPRCVLEHKRAPAVGAPLLLLHVVQHAPLRHQVELVDVVLHRAYVPVVQLQRVRRRRRRHRRRRLSCCGARARYACAAAHRVVERGCRAAERVHLERVEACHGQARVQLVERERDEDAALRVRDDDDLFARLQRLLVAPRWQGQRVVQRKEGRAHVVGAVVEVALDEALDEVEEQTCVCRREGFSREEETSSQRRSKGDTSRGQGTVGAVVDAANGAPECRGEHVGARERHVVAAFLRAVVSVASWLARERRLRVGNGSKSLRTWC